LLGKQSLREAAAKVFVTGTFFLQAVPLAAALATLQELGAVGAIDHMQHMGMRLCEGLAERASAAGLEVKLSGPPSMPFMSFTDDDKGFDRNRAFCGAAAQRGAFFHPHHNWFLSAAHQETDIDEALDIAEKAFAEVRKVF
jgi:glutamate-1-semialdehyde 2,1-aminomutase